MIRRFWTEDEINLLIIGYPDTPTKLLAKSLQRSTEQIYRKADHLGLKKSDAYMHGPHAYRLRRGDNVGKATQFKAGHKTWNAGMKGLDIGGKETRFKKGQPPHNHNPIGHTRETKEGYLQRKITDTRCTRRDYVAIHHLVWRLHGNTIPAGHALVFLDGNNRNFGIANLELVSRAELMRRNSYHNRLPKELAELVQLRGAITRQINKRDKEYHEQRH